MASKQPKSLVAGMGVWICVALIVGASLARPDPLDLAWPSVHAPGLDALARSTPREVCGFAARPGIDPASLPPDVRDSIAPIYVVGHVDRTATGLLRVFERVRPRDENEFTFRGFEPNASFIPDTWWATFGDRTMAHAAGVREMRATWVEHRDDIELGVNSDDIALDAGIAMWIPPVPAADAPEPRGIILRLEAITANEFEAKALRGLADAGWAIIRIDTRARIDPPNQREILEATHRSMIRRETILRELVRAYCDGHGAADIPDDAYRSMVARADERVSREVLIPRSEFLWREGDDVDAKAELIARAVDVTLSQNAFAARAVLDYVDAHRPDLSGKPVVIAGFSAGALTAPAVATLLGERVRALILVGAGADLLTIASTSDLTTGGLDLAADGPLAPERLGPLVDAYRAHADLDPYALAPTLRVPTLLILAMFDATVPVATASLLAERLEGEQRIDLPTEHRALFAMLPLVAERIAAWTLDAVGEE